MQKNTSEKTTIYTDGACSPNPGPGGWGAVIIAPSQKKVELKGSSKKTTNNRMEIRAALEALASLRKSTDIILFTDSKYLQKGVLEWLPNWQKKGWKTSDNDQVKNRDLWENLASQVSRHNIEWCWIKGHSDNKWNERADFIARSSVYKKSLPLNDYQAIHIFTAVSFLNKTKQGSWAAMLTYREHRKLLFEQTSQTTGNRLHIMAAINGLAAIKDPKPIHIYTFSGYLKDGASRWTKQWANNNWHTREGGAVSHQDLWQKLDRLNNKYQVKYHIASKAVPPCEMQGLKLLAGEIAKEER